MSIRNKIKQLWYNNCLFLKRKYTKILLSKQFRNYLSKSNIPNKKAQGEDEYLNFWKQFSSKVEPYSYRFFSKYMGYTPKIVPEDIGRCYLEYYLNPIRYRDYYLDKNLYMQYIPTKCLPKTVLCRINGGRILDSSYKPIFDNDNQYIDENTTEYKLAEMIGGADKLVIKPSIDTCGGIGIKFFSLHDNVYTSTDNVILDGKFLLNLGNDFVMQEYIKQHDFFSFFNPTSVNTLRMCTYRSVTDEKVIVFACALRIGGKGALVDNTHSGGALVKIDPITGELGKYVIGQYRKSYNEWNDIDFEHNNYVVPYWDKIIDFAKLIASQNHHMRLLALDVSVDNNGTPVLIEYNTDDFSFGLPLSLGQIPFGERFQEVVDYCLIKEKERKGIIRKLP